jgi:hypothetical protein
VGHLFLEEIKKTCSFSFLYFLFFSSPVGIGPRLEKTLSLVSSVVGSHLLPCLRHFIIAREKSNELFPRSRRPWGTVVRSRGVR